MSNANEPAFPFGQVSERTGQPINGLFAAGLTKREYIAAMALQGLCANSGEYGEGYEDITASKAVKSADALLAELAKGEPQ